MTGRRKLTLQCPDYIWVEVADRIRRGEATALTELYDSTCPLVYGLMVRILGEGLAAQEALVEAYLGVWSGIQSFDCRRSSLLTWTILLARRVALEWPGRQVPPSGTEAPGYPRTLERAIFDGVVEGDLRLALSQSRVGQADLLPPKRINKVDGNPRAIKAAH